RRPPEAGQPGARGSRAKRGWPVQVEGEFTRAIAFSPLNAAEECPGIHGRSSRESPVCAEPYGRPARGIGPDGSFQLAVRPPHRRRVRAPDRRYGRPPFYGELGRGDPAGPSLARAGLGRGARRRGRLRPVLPEAAAGALPRVCPAPGGAGESL